MIETPVHRRRPGHRQRAGHADSAERPAGDRIDLPVGPGHVRAGRRPQHQQELSDRHDLGRRRAGQRHHLHHGRRHPQRSVQQPEPADAVSRCAAGVQGRDQLAAGAVRPSRRVGGEPRDQVGHQLVPRERVRVRPRLPLQRAELLRGRRATASSATSSAARSAAHCSRTSCSSSAATRAGSRRANPPTTVSFVPTAAMLAGDFTAIASPACSGAPDHAGAGGRLRRQHDQSDAPSTRSR